MTHHSTFPGSASYWPYWPQRQNWCSNDIYQSKLFRADQTGSKALAEGGKAEDPALLGSHGGPQRKVRQSDRRLFLLWRSWPSYQRLSQAGAATQAANELDDEQQQKRWRRRILILGNEINFCNHSKIFQANWFQMIDLSNFLMIRISSSKT